MSIMLRVLLIAMSVISSFYVIWRIRNSKMQIEYALFWIIMAVLMIIMSVFPQIVYWITGKMGMMSPANVVYLFIIAILLIKTFMMTIELSSLENKFKDLTQQIAINEKQAADEKKETIGDKMEQINVLVSTYNGEKYIEEQLKSIDCQTYSNVHVYVRDDGSTDHTVELVNRYIRENELSDKYTVATGENIGFSKSFHLLMQMADSGEYWAFCDQDDVWYPNKLSNAVKWMQTQKNDIPLLYQSKIAIGNSDLSEIVPYKYENYNYNFQKAFTSNIFLDLPW